MSKNSRHRQAVNGWIAINKPSGYNSTKIVSIIKRYYNAQKVGHAGTLDPLAQGVLPIAMGEATKTIIFCQDAIKEYIFTVKWTQETDSCDSEGKVISVCDKVPNKDEILISLPMFIGTISQTPPSFSAIKIDGKRAYDLARNGEEFFIKPRLITIFALKLIEHNHDEFTSTFKVKCSKGTYIRSLARDLAEKLTTKAHVISLIRTQVGNFYLDNAISLEVFDNKMYKPSSDGLLLAVDSVLDDIPVLLSNPEEAIAIRQGRNIKLKDHNYIIGEKLIIKSEGKLVAIGEVGNGFVKPSRVFNI